MSSSFDPTAALVLLTTASLKGVWVMALVLAVRIAFRSRIPRRWHYALWTLVAVRLMMPVGPSLPASVVPASVDGVRLPGLVGLDTSPEAAAPVSESGMVFSWSLALLAIWSAGVGLVVLRDTAGRRRLRSLISRARAVDDPDLLGLLGACKRRIGVRGEVALLTTGDLDAPAVLPGRRAAILLPESALEAPDREPLRYVFLHELAHLRQGDGMADRLTRLLVALHWFNPAVHWAAKLSSADREAACDERVIRRLTPSDRRAYGLALLSATTRRADAFVPAGLVAMAGSPTDIERRIRMIARFKPTRRRSLVLPTLALACVVVLGLAELPAQTEGATEPSSSEGGKEALRTTVERLRDAGSLLYGQWTARHGDPVQAEGAAEPTEIDWRLCPAISREKLAATLGLASADQLPATDGWGHPVELCFREQVSEGGAWPTLGIRSPGRDGSFEGPVYAVGGFPGGQLDHDVVWMDGTFIRWPLPQ